MIENLLYFKEKYIVIAIQNNAKNISKYFKYLDSLLILNITKIGIEFIKIE